MMITRPLRPAARMLALALTLGALCLAPGAAPRAETARTAATDLVLHDRAAMLRDGAPIALEEWQAMTAGRTVWYFANGRLWGREVYRIESDRGGEVTFQHSDGECLDANWTYADNLYCFDFGGGPSHCFHHIRWRGGIYAISLSGDVQEVRRIDAAPLSCGMVPLS